MKEIALTLSDLGDGGLEERFQRELVKVLENIADPNTKGEAKRKITITLEFIPSEDRKVFAIKCNVASALAADDPFSAFAMLRRDGDTLSAIETRTDDGGPEPDPRQVRLMPTR